MKNKKKGWGSFTFLIQIIRFLISLQLVEILCSFENYYLNPKSFVEPTRNVSFDTVSLAINPTTKIESSVKLGNSFTAQYTLQTNQTIVVDNSIPLEPMELKTMNKQLVNLNKSLNKLLFKTQNIDHYLNQYNLHINQNFFVEGQIKQTVSHLNKKQYANTSVLTIKCDPFKNQFGVHAHILLEKVDIPMIFQLKSECLYHFCSSSDFRLYPKMRTITNLDLGCFPNSKAHFVQIGFRSNSIKNDVGFCPYIEFGMQSHNIYEKKVVSFETKKEVDIFKKNYTKLTYTLDKIGTEVEQYYKTDTVNKISQGMEQFYKRDTKQFLPKLRGGWTGTETISESPQPVLTNGIGASVNSNETSDDITSGEVVDTDGILNSSSLLDQNNPTQTSLASSNNEISGAVFSESTIFSETDLNLFFGFLALFIFGGSLAAYSQSSTLTFNNPNENPALSQTGFLMQIFGLFGMLLSIFGKNWSKKIDEIAHSCTDKAVKEGVEAAEAVLEQYDLKAIFLLVKIILGLILFFQGRGIVKIFLPNMNDNDDGTSGSSANFQPLGPIDPTPFDNSKPQLPKKPLLPKRKPKTVKPFISRFPKTINRINKPNNFV